MNTITILQDTCHRTGQPMTRIYVDGTGREVFPGWIEVTLPTVMAWINQRYTDLTPSNDNLTVEECLGQGEGVLCWPIR